MGDGTIEETDNEFPIDTDFIRDDDFVGFLQSRGASSIRRVVPSLLPCRDTLSIARRGDTVRTYDFWNMMLVTFNVDGTLDIPNMAIYMTMLYQNAIKIAEPNWVVYYPSFDDPPELQKTAVAQPNDSAFYTQSLLHQWDPPKGRYGSQLYSTNDAIPPAWDRTMGNSSITVGIIDDGIDDRHPDYGSQGQVVIGGYNYFSADNYYEKCFHGTHVAGIVGALTNNNYGIAGIAGGSGTQGVEDNVKLVALKTGQGTAGGHAIGNTAALTPAIIEGSRTAPGGVPGNTGWSCDILNLSVGSPSAMEILRNAVAWSYLNDVIVTVAIGNVVASNKSVNYKRPTYPAGVDDQWVLCVGGSYERDIFISSKTGTVMDIMAPFSNKTTGIVYDSAGNASSYLSVTTFAGTSGSSPHIAGIAALLFAYRDTLSGQGQPVPHYLAPEDVTMLMAEGVSVEAVLPRLDGYQLEKNHRMGYGIVNAEGALSRLASPFNLEHETVELNLDPGSFTLDTAPLAFSVDSGFTVSGLYPLRKYHIIADADLPDTYPHLKRAWARGAPSKGVYPDLREIEVDTGGSIPLIKPLPLYQNVCWANVLEFNSVSCKIETYLYQYQDPSGSWHWLGIDPDNFEVTVTLSLLSDSNYTVSNTLVETNSFEISDLYPNPVASQSNSVSLDIVSTDVQEVEVYMFDALGREVTTLSRVVKLDQGRNTVTLKTNGLPVGTYYIRVSDGNAFYTSKLIVTE